jgi:hypothetical protein
VRTEQSLSVNVQGYLPPHNFTVRLLEFLAGTVFQSHWSGCKAKIGFYNLLSRLIERIVITRISEFESGSINHLAEESLSQGFRFVERLIRE